MKTKLLITGGAGYIGSVLTAYFLDKDFEVVIYDDLSTGNSIDAKATIINGSILDTPKLITALTNIDIVIHCAAKALVEESFASAQLYSQVNTDGTSTLLKAMIQTGVDKL